MTRLSWIILGLLLPVLAAAGCSQSKGTASGESQATTDMHEGHGHQKAPETAREETKTQTVAQTECPVMGKPIDTNVYTDHAGKRVYFCCPGCIDAFKKDPAKYLAKLK